MDFEMHYTAEQEKFRQEVREWIKANTRPELKPPTDPANLTREQFDYGHELRSKVGAKGWLAPLYPKEYGGGGLSREEAVILAEELADEDLPSLGDLGLTLGAPAIMVWGTEEQKQRFLPGILKGEAVTWQCFTEPDAGTDLASLKTRADKDGDYYVINGQKIFVGAAYDASWLYTLAITDQSKPRHANMGAFMVPANAPGVTIQPLRIVGGGWKNTIYYDNVRVTRDHIVGGETDGWRVAQSTLEVEHGGSGSVNRRDKFLDKVIQYCREAQRNGKPMSKDQDVRDHLMEIYAGAQVLRLFGLRNYWMRTSKVAWAWEGSQNSLYGKNRMPKVAKEMLNLAGPYALTSDPKRQPLTGEFEVQQRGSMLTHPGGTPEAQKIIMGRRMGIARTREKAAAIV